MRKTIIGAIAFLAAWLILSMGVDRCNAQTQATQQRLSDLAVSRIALMPFLMGRLESLDAPIGKPTREPAAKLEINDQELPPDADQAMTRVVDGVLKQRVEERLIVSDRVAEACRAPSTNEALDTVRKRAVNLGNVLDVPVVMVGNVWQYREKGALTDVPDSPAAVGFALYLIDVETGDDFWTGGFQGVQETLSDDVVGGLKQLDMGLRWLSVEELARYGVKSALRPLPLN